MMFGGLLIFIIVLVILFRPDFLRNLFGSERGEIKANPLEILKERYARGELSEEEYIKMKKNLEGGN